MKITIFIADKIPIMDKSAVELKTPLRDNDRAAGRRQKTLV